MGTKEAGQKGEDLACEYLVNNGYKILERNYRINFGEIDIIAKKKGLFSDKTIHFVEVKSLASAGDFFPEQRVDFKKQKKLKQLAEIYLSKNKISPNTPHQVDIIAVSGQKIDFFGNVVAEK